MHDAPDVTVYAIPFFLITMALEAFLLHRRGHGHPKWGYHPRDTAASISGGLGSIAVRAMIASVLGGLFAWLWKHRLTDLGTGHWAWLALLIADDLCAYTSHRAAHSIRFLWAAHVVHHSSPNFTLATALRQSWTEPLTATPFWLVLPFIGFRPEMVLIMRGVSLIYQYWVHTELIRSIGPLEWVFNSPSHHRVHHASDAKYLDKNHGAIFIIWDRMFGTFQKEEEAPTYGIVKPIDSTHPITIQVGEWSSMVQDVQSASTPRDALRAVFDSPANLSARPVQIRS